MSVKDITLGRYVYGTSLLHRLDPRTKLISLLAVMTALFAGNGWIALCFTGIFCISACAMSGLKPFYFIRSILPFKWLILMTVLLNVVFIGGHILIEAPFPYGGITSEGLSSGLLYGARIVLLVSMASLLTLTTEPIVLVDGVEKLLKPFSKIGLKHHEIALAMVITIRFIPILLDEADKIRKSHIARGLRPDKDLRHKIRSASILLLPLFTSAVRRAENLAVAMDCRLYRSDINRTRYIETKISLKDWTALTISFIFVLSIVVIT